MGTGGSALHHQHQTGRLLRTQSSHQLHDTQATLTRMLGNVCCALDPCASCRCAGHIFATVQHLVDAGERIRPRVHHSRVTVVPLATH